MGKNQSHLTDPVGWLAGNNLFMVAPNTLEYSWWSLLSIKLPNREQSTEHNYNGLGFSKL